MTLILENPYFIQAMTVVHLTGLCMGFGGALFTDLLGLRLLFASRDLPVDAVIDRIPRFVGLGLVMIWVSGLAIASTKYTPDTVPAEIKTKFVLLGFLTLNALLIRRRLTRLTQMWGSPRVFNMKFLKLVQIIALGCMPFAAWSFSLLITKMPILQTMPLKEMLNLAVTFWLACAVSFVVLITLTRAIIAARAAMSGRTVVRPVARRDVRDANAGQRTRTPQGRSRRNPKMPPARVTANDNAGFENGGFDNGGFDQNPPQNPPQNPNVYRNNGQQYREPSYSRQVPQDRNPRAQQSMAERALAPGRPENRAAPVNRPRNANGPRLNEATQYANRQTSGASIDYMEDYREARGGPPSRNGALLRAITEVPVVAERRVEPRGARRWWEGV